MGLFDNFFQQPQQQNTTTQTQSTPSWAIPFQQGSMQNAWNVANRPGNGVYQGTQVAPFNQDQFNAMDMVRSQAGDNSLYSGASNTLQSIMGGNWQPGQSPSASGMSGGGMVGGNLGGVNPYLNEMNQYGQEGNPFLQQQIDNTSKDMTKSWENSAMAGWLNNMASRGASGGSNRALTQVGGDIASDLQRNIGAMSTNVRAGDFDRRAQLEEARLGRRFGAGEADLNRQAQDRAQSLNLAASQSSANASRDASMYNSRLNAALQASQLAPSINNMGYTGANNLMGIGNQQQGNMQDMIGADMRNFEQWYREPERRQGLFSQWTGNPTQGNSQTQTNTPSYGPSTAQNLAGMYGLGRSFGLFGG